MASIDFVHLHVHSSFSLLEGALTIARLAELAKADHQPALALTDVLVVQRPHIHPQQGKLSRGGDGFRGQTLSGALHAEHE